MLAISLAAIKFKPSKKKIPLTPSSGGKVNAPNSWFLFDFNN
jgi:hypothetical protein